MTLEEEFERNWENRYEIEPELRGSLEDYWKNEEELYYLIATVDRVRDEAEKILNKVENIEGITQYDKEFLHITVKLFGKNKPDKNKIKQVLREFEPFRVHFGKINLFPEVLLIESLTPEIREINKHLGEHFSQQSHEGENYLPHLSIGHYNSNTNWDETASKIKTIREKYTLPSFKVNSLLLVKDKDTERPDYEVEEKFKLDD